jgi:DNA invertase Pin-like site-specific DNA recombinase
VKEPRFDDPHRESNRFLRERNAYPETLSPEDFATYQTMRAAEELAEWARREQMKIALKKRGHEGLRKAHQFAKDRRADHKRRIRDMLTADPFRSRAEICRELGISRTKLYDLIHEIEAEQQSKEGR